MDAGLLMVPGHVIMGTVLGVTLLPLVVCSSQWAPHTVHMTLGVDIDYYNQFSVSKCEIFSKPSPNEVVIYLTSILSPRIFTLFVCHFCVNNKPNITLESRKNIIHD